MYGVGGARLDEVVALGALGTGRARGRQQLSRTTITMIPYFPVSLLL